MARTRGKRKFYPEFYTDEELAQMENSDEANKSESNTEATEPVEDADGEASKIDKTKETGAVPEQTTSPSPSQPQIQTQKSPTQTANPSLTNATGAPKRNGASSKTSGSSRTSTSNTAANTSGKSADATSSPQTTSSNTGARRTSKKIDLKDIDKAIPDDVREKLYSSQPANKKTDTVLKRLEAMQKDYISQKLNVSKSEMPAGARIQDGSEPNLNEANVTDESNAGIERQVISNQPEEEVKEVYNDYPFDDEPYKIMDIAEMVMSQGTEPYNDSPYENVEPTIEIETVANEDNTEDSRFESEKFAEEIIEPTGGEYAEYDEYIADEDEQYGQSEQSEEENSLENTINKYVRYINKKYGVPANIVPFDIENAIIYAHRWALDRNPQYLDYDELGGDCTNYISQILLAGGCPMDRTPVFGWYYTDGNNKSPSWTGVEQLYKYLIKDKDFGIFAREIDMQEVEAGDIVQLSFNGKTFQHTPFIVSVGRDTDGTVRYDGIKICAHSFDSENRPLDTYKWKAIRFIRVFGHIPKQ